MHIKTVKIKSILKPCLVKIKEIFNNDIMPIIKIKLVDIIIVSSK